MVTDAKSFEPWFEDMPMSNPLNTEGYEDKVKATQEKTGLKEAVTVGKALIHGEPAVIGICDARFLMSSMGYVVGEKIARAVERATEEKLPVFMFCCSGGARMQGGYHFVDADGKNFCGIEEAFGSRTFVCIYPDRPDDRRRDSQLCNAWRYHFRRAGRTGWICRTSCYQADDWTGPSGRIPAFRILVEHGIIDGIITRDKMKDVMYQLIVTHKQRDGYANFNKENDEKFDISEILKRASDVG